jgi:hypothetical protein
VCKARRGSCSSEASAEIIRCRCRAARPGPAHPQVRDGRLSGLRISLEGTTDAPDNAPFDPYAFSTDLINAQRAAVEAYQALHDYQATLLWSREPHEEWEEEQPAHGGALCGYH